MIKKKYLALEIRISINISSSCHMITHCLKFHPGVDYRLQLSVQLRRTESISRELGDGALSSTSDHKIVSVEIPGVFFKKMQSMKGAERKFYGENYLLHY